MSIILDNVCYKDKINNISYTFLDNEINVITGNSCKSLLTYLILGLVKIDSGLIIVDNYKITRNTKKYYNIRKSIGYVFQDAKYEFFCSSCYKELEFTLKRYNIKDNYNKKIKSIFKMVDLPYEYLDKNPFDLSSGEQVKLCIALALIHNPHNLIFDDITHNLDNKTREMIINLLIRLKKKYNKAIIIVSNDIDFILEIYDNIVILDNGNIIRKDNVIDDISLLRSGISNVPRILEFIYLYNSVKNRKLKYTLDINCLVKDIVNE